MKNSYRERYFPFSHTPGVKVPIPGSRLIGQFYPAKLCIYYKADNEPQKICELPLNIQGPVKEFTVQLDVEREVVKVWGIEKRGAFRFRCFVEDKKLVLRADRDLNGQLFAERQTVFSLDNQFLIAKSPIKTDCLSLGVHKQQDMEKVSSRRDAQEIIPLYFSVAKLFLDDEKNSGPSLIQDCKECIENKERLSVSEHFLDVFLAGFEGIFTPRSYDHSFWGYDKPPVVAKTPFALFSEGYRLIRELFVSQLMNKVFILPCLPVEFHSGKMTDIALPGIGVLALEWSKKTIRKMELIATHTQPVSFEFQHDIKSFRIKSYKNEKGIRCLCQNTLEIEKGNRYILDNFQK